MNPTNETDAIKLPETAQEVAETLADGTNISIELTNGNREIVKVRRIPRREFTKFAPLAFVSLAPDSDETPEAAYYLDKSLEFAQSMTEDSLDAVLMEGRRLNFSRFASWANQRAELLKMMQGKAPTLSALVTAIAGQISKG